MSTVDETLIKAETLKALLVARAVGQQPDGEEYVRLRSELMKDHLAKTRLPRFIKHCRTIPEFWAFIQPQFASYRERQRFLAEEFDPLLTKLEEASLNPAIDSSSEILSAVDSVHIQEAWQKAMDRRVTDPEGAVTMARTLLETVCKHVLDKGEIAYADDCDLPKLYRLVAERLNLAPSQHTDQILKRIFGSCSSVVEGLGALRNRVSDAHGPGKFHVKPEPRHAALAVNLAGSMASFLIETLDVVSNAASS